MCVNNSNRDDGPLRLPTINWSQPIEPQPNYVGAAIPHPPGFDPRQHSEPETPDDWRPPRPSDLFAQDNDAPPASWGSPIDAPGIARPFVTNSAPKEDSEPLRLPYVNWAVE